MVTSQSVNLCVVSKVANYKTILYSGFTDLCIKPFACAQDPEHYMWPLLQAVNYHYFVAENVLSLVPLLIS